MRERVLSLPPEQQTLAGMQAAMEDADFEKMEEIRARVDDVVADPATAEGLKAWYRQLCKRPCFHDEYLEAYNNLNVTLVDCPAGIDRVTETGLVVDGKQYDVDCIVYGTGFEPELTPLHRRAGHEIVGREGVTLAEKWAVGPQSLFGMLTRGFPNLFLMPAPVQQAVVPVNYTHLAVTGADFVAGAIRRLIEHDVAVFDVAEEAEERWTQGVVDRFVDASAHLSACTPSRINQEGNPKAMGPRNGNFGGGLGDFFGYRDLLEQWVERGDFEGLEIDGRPAAERGA
jgi:cation diffusion facilitator CzcD-associated flavoprotein CzcO